MPGNLVKSVMLKIQSSDGDTEEKLDRISEKADELARLHPDIKVKVDSAAASAKLAVLRHELKDTADQGEKTKLTFKGVASDIAEMATGLGAGSSAVGEMSMLQKVMLGLNIATGLGEPLIAGATVAVGGLSAGLVSAGAGLGVFGLVAKSVWSGVSKNISAAAAAQQKIAAGATGKNLIADNKALAASLKGLNDGQKSLVLGAANDELSWHKFVQSASGGVASVLVPALGLVPRALQLARGFLAPVEAALRNVVAYVSKGLNSQGFTSFIHMLQANAGPMIEKLAHAIGNVVIGIGGILRAFMPVAQRIGSGLDDLTGKFAKWGSTLSGHSGFQSLMAMFKSETPLAMNALKQLAGIIKVVVSQMTGMSTFSNSKMLLQLALPILKLVNALLKAHPQLVWLILYLKLAADGGKKLKGAFDGISAAVGGLKTGSKALSDLKSGFSDAEAAASDATGAWGSMGGKLSTVLQKLGLMKTVQAEATVATEGETAAQGELDVAMDANPIGLIVVAVAALAAGMYELIKHVTPVRDFFKDLWRDLKNWFSDGIDFIKSHWKLLPAIFLGPLGLVATIVLTHFDDIKRYASDLVDDVRSVLDWFGRLPGLFMGWFDEAANAVYSVTGKIVSFVRGIPGKIISGLSDLGSMLFGLGESAMKSLLSGLSSVVGGIIGTAESWGHDIANAIGSPFGIHFSEPSQATQMLKAGRRVALDFASGISGGQGTVSAAFARMIGTATGQGALTRLGTAGAGELDVVVRVEPAGSQLSEAIAQLIRVEALSKGGGATNSVQKTFGQRW